MRAPDWNSGEQARHISGFGDGLRPWFFGIDMNVSGITKMWADVWVLSTALMTVLVKQNEWSNKLIIATFFILLIPVILSIYLDNK
jgi:hypothetical protein